MNLFCFHSNFRNLTQDFLGESQFLYLELAVWQSAEVKQIEHIDFQQLEGANIVEGIIKLCLLSAKVGP